MIIPQYMTLSKGIERAYITNKDMLLLGEEAESYTLKILARKIIPKILRDNALLKHVWRDGKSQTTEEGVIKLINDIDEYLKIKRQVESLQDHGPPRKNWRGKDNNEGKEKPRVQLDSDKEDVDSNKD